MLSPKPDPSRSKYMWRIRFRNFSQRLTFTSKSYGWALLPSTLQCLTPSDNYRAQEAPAHLQTLIALMEGRLIVPRNPNYQLKEKGPICTCNWIFLSQGTERSPSRPSGESLAPRVVLWRHEPHQEHSMGQKPTLWQPQPLTSAPEACFSRLTWEILANEEISFNAQWDGNSGK